MGDSHFLVVGEWRVCILGVEFVALVGVFEVSDGGQRVFEKLDLAFGGEGCGGVDLSGKLEIHERIIIAM